MDRLLPFQFDIEHLPGAKMGLVDYIFRHPSQKAKKVSAYDGDLIVAKLKLISTFLNTLELNDTKSASHLRQLFIAHNPALQITPKIEAHDPALQTTPKIEANKKAINLINTNAARVYKHVFYNSPAPQKLASNTNCNLNNLKYVDPASQNPLNTSLAQRNTSKRKQLFQIRNELTLAHYHLNHCPLSEINYINKISNIMPSKKRITCVRFNDASCSANQQSSNPPRKSAF